MARSAKSSGEGTKSPLNQIGAPLFDWFFRPSFLIRASLLAGACALWPYLAQKLPSLGKRSEYRLPFRRIQICPHPDRPVPLNLVEQVEQMADVSDDLSILDENLTIEVARIFRRHPWVSNVLRVQKSFPAAVTVELEYRKPVALVETATGRIPIDVHAVILPSTDFSASDITTFPLIQGITSAPASRPGIEWSDPGLVAAARLAHLLLDDWKSLKLGAIVVPRSTNSETDPNDVPLELATEGGSRIVWGRPPGNDHPGELEATQKIRRLEKYLAEFGDYGKPNGPYEIDIRHWQEISRRPLKVEQAQGKATKGRNDPKPQISEGKRKSRS